MQRLTALLWHFKDHLSMRLPCCATSAVSWLISANPTYSFSSLQGSKDTCLKLWLILLCFVYARFAQNISSNGDSLQSRPNGQSVSDKFCQWNSKSILTSLFYTDTTGLNFYCFLQVTISATEICADLRTSSQKTLTLRQAIQHTLDYMIIFRRPVKALWWPKAYPNSGLNLASHLWQQRIFDCTLTALLYWQS